MITTNKKALIVDDDPLVCKILEKLLTKRGIGVVITSNGNEANGVILHQGHTLAMAFVDLVLPSGVTGWDIIDFIRSTPSTARTPIVILTGADISEKEEQRLIGKNSKILRKKDFNIDAFDQVLDTLLQGLQS